MFDIFFIKLCDRIAVRIKHEWGEFSNTGRGNYHTGGMFTDTANYTFKSSGYGDKFNWFFIIIDLSLIVEIQKVGSDALAGLTFFIDTHAVIEARARAFWN